MRSLVFLALLIGTPFLIYKKARPHYEQKAIKDMALLEQRTKELGATLVAALAKDSSISGEEALESLAAFTHPSGQTGGLAFEEFWDSVAFKGTFESVGEDSYALGEKLYQIGPTYWPDGKNYKWVFFPNILKLLRIGHVWATSTIVGRGIPSEETLNAIIEAMRTQGTLENYVIFHGKPTVTKVIMNTRWVYHKNNWFLDPKSLDAFTHEYRPQPITKNENAL